MYFRFVDNVTFSKNVPYGDVTLPHQLAQLYSIPHGLTPVALRMVLRSYSGVSIVIF